MRTDTARITPDNRAQATTVTPAPPMWDPPSEPPEPIQVGETCPACGDRVWTTGRGTLRVCVATCKHRVIPAGVRAPYERGTAAVRQVRSQRERDLEALALARRQGIMLAQLARLADDDRLHPESRPVVEWFAGQVKAATTEARLGELVMLLPEAGIRRQHWWQGKPAAIPAGHADDEDEDDGDTVDGYAIYAGEDDEGEDEDQGGNEPAAMFATPESIAAQQWRAQPLPMTWAGAVAACGWRLSPVIGGCQIVEMNRLCGAETTRSISGGWVCGRHYEALATVIIRSGR